MSLAAFLDNLRPLPLISPATCSGVTYIIVGGNCTLDLETTPDLETTLDLVATNATKVIIATRNTQVGQQAQTDIKATTGRKNVVEVWHVDRASFASVIRFGDRVISEIDRVGALICNAGVALDKWTFVDHGYESCVMVNVLGTLYFGMLLHSKLEEVTRRYSRGTESSRGYGGILLNNWMLLILGVYRELWETKVPRDGG